ncbi:MAG: hypothetical protein U1C97_01110, partial [Candidatus Gracilibacteria bacterium]|nr:hypothetical protein [Candidatus Gracilibacteria bacterium]
MKLFSTLTLVLLLTLLLPVQVAYAQSDQPGRPIGGLVKETAESLVDEILYDNIAALAGPSCNLYTTGLDFVNSFWDGMWSPILSALDITVLFRNQPWRELIWGLEDERDSLLAELSKLKKQECVTAFGLAQPVISADVVTTRRQQESLFRLRKNIVTQEAKLDYLGVERWNLLYQKPQFGDAARIDIKGFSAPILETDKIFYWLVDPTSVFPLSWEQVAREANQFGERSMEDLGVLYENLPDTCFAVTNMAENLLMTFTFSLIPDGNRFRDTEGNYYEGFADFVARNQILIRDEYGEQCRRAAEGAIPEPDKTSAEQQFEAFQESLKLILEKAQERYLQVEAESLRLESSLLKDQQVLESGQIPPETQKKLEQVWRLRGMYLGLIDYHTMALNKVGSSSSESLKKIGEHLSQFVEAVLGVKSDKKGALSSRLSLSERFEDSQERTFQKLCSRLEAMYRESGRSTADLPVIGSANGHVYCRANPDCADVNLLNFTGGSEGWSKLAECSGFTFNSGELGPSQATADVIDEVGEDIGYLLQQRSLNDLLKAKNLHFEGLRARYNGLYGAQTGTTALLDVLLADVSTQLFKADVKEYSESTPSTKTHYSLLKSIYDRFWTFANWQEG